ncbi:MAG: BON domain-containing protein [Planctomycetia bacterium]|nr:BON domain-containing protein [Planctomycetia bacterium]
MRRSFVLLVFAFTMAFAATSVQAGNQDEANKIARQLGQMYPQYNIEVAYQDGKVRLRGEIASEADRDEINNLVSQMPQVKSVQEMFSITETEEAEPANSAVVPKPNFFPTQKLPEANLIDQGNVVSVFAEEPAFPLVEEAEPVSSPVLPSIPTEAPKTEPMVQETVVTALPAPTAPAYAQDAAPAVEVEPAPAIVDAPAAVAAPAPAPAPVLAPVPAPVPAPIAAPVPAPIVAEQGIVEYQGANYLPPRGVAIGANAQPYPAAVPANYPNAPQGAAMVPGQNGQPSLPNYAWPTYADYPNYSQVAYPKQYGARAFPYVGPFYPYPQVPLGWRKVTMEWHDGYWWLDFNDGSMSGPFSPLFRQPTKYR